MGLASAATIVLRAGDTSRNHGWGEQRGDGKRQVLSLQDLR
jgi:hypothetical protein